VSQNRIPNINDCNLKKDYQILITFGTNIPDTAGATKRPFKFPPHPMPAAALPAKYRTIEICVEINKNVNKFHLSGSADPTALTSVRSTTRFGCYAAASLGMLINSRSDWLSLN